MHNQNPLQQIESLKQQIAVLPIGSISKKKINGKIRFYHQWTENGKTKSKYLRDGEMEPLQKQIEERRELQKELRMLQAKLPKHTGKEQNIQHSLACYEDGGHFRHLYDLYEAGELAGAINRIIEDMNHRFLLSVLTRDFVSHDLGIAASNLRKEGEESKRTDVLDTIDTEK